MSTHKHIDKICCVVLAVTLLITLLFINGEKLGITASSVTMGYASKLFDTTTVHSIDIVMDDWEEFIANCASEEYAVCTVIIDNEVYKNVAIRAKGNTSLTQVQSYGNGRYSFKIEFDHYDSSKTYYGLDKLCLNNIIQDNTYMKDYLTYQMMGAFGVASPLCSYVYITVNGEDWGLYLAVEGVEESFLQRNYGNDYGNLYKPDSQSMGGSPDDGKDFDMAQAQSAFHDDFAFADFSQSAPQMPAESDESDDPLPDDMQREPEQRSEDSEIPSLHASPGDMAQADDPNGNQGGMGSDDVKLIYSDDSYESYSNIFDNAKTDISDSDKERLIASLKSLNENVDIDHVVDVESVIRYFVVHNFVLNFDSYTGSMIHNYYLYEKDGQLSMIPWDYNLAFGGFQSSADATSLVNFPIDSPVSGGNADDRPMLAWIFADEEYTELYHQLFSEFISDYFDSGYFAEMIDSVKAMIAPYVEQDPTKFCTYEEFITGIDTLKEFCLLRAESISGQLNGTIGSTSDTQTRDTLVDASSITVSDMGSMDNSMSQGVQPAAAGFGANDGGMPPQDMHTAGRALPMLADDDGTADVFENADAGGNELSPQDSNGDAPLAQNNGQEPMEQMPGGQMPDNTSMENRNPENNSPMQNMPGQSMKGGMSSWILLGVSVCALLLGLFIAFLYKRS